MRLTYQAYNPSGQLIEGMVDASDISTAKESLRQGGLFVTQITQAQAQASITPSSKHRIWMSRGRVLKELAFFTRQLSVMVATGTPLTQSLYALEQQARSIYWKQILGDLESRVRQGNSLSQAMEDHPLVFDSVYRSLVSAGETSGHFTQVLSRLAELKLKQYQLRTSLVGVMVYPLLLLTMSSVVLTVLLVVALPRFVELFESMDVPMPPTTVLLVNVSDLLIGYWWALPPILLFGVIGLMGFLRSPSGRRMWDVTVLRVPKFGKIVQGFITARLVRLLGVLLQSHVPLLDTLGLCKQAAGNVRYEQLIVHAQEVVTRGQPISEAFADAQLISPTVYQTMRSGEQSGQIGPLMLNIADFLDDENDVVLRSLTSLIEPLILIGLGIFVGFVAVSLFMPLFDLTSLAGAGR